MLSTLVIKNFALIENQTIEFKKGFNADFVEFMDMHKVYRPVIYFLFEKCGYKLRDLKLTLSNKFKKKG